MQGAISHLELWDLGSSAGLDTIRSLATLTGEEFNDYLLIACYESVYLFLIHFK